MCTSEERQTYLAKLDAEINRLVQRMNALEIKIEDMKSIEIDVRSQVELLATMRVAMKSLAVARADALRVLETGENRDHPRAEK